MELKDKGWFSRWLYVVRVYLHHLVNFLGEINHPITRISFLPVFRPRQCDWKITGLKQKDVKFKRLGE